MIPTLHTDASLTLIGQGWLAELGKIGRGLGPRWREFACMIDR
jgi:hypothetical protein